jgi:DNA-binding NarL/FixJ family response regulator
MHNPASATNGLKGGRPPKYNRDQIIALYQSGLTKDQIAAQLNCTWRTVHRVLINCKQFPNPIDKT